MIYNDSTSAIILRYLAVHCGKDIHTRRIVAYCQLMYNKNVSVVSTTLHRLTQQQRIQHLRRGYYSL